MKHLMVDLETLSTTPAAGILSIGAYAFDESGGFISDFYRPVTLESCLDREVSASTLRWWAKQPDEARQVFYDERAVPLKEALTEFSDYCTSTAPDCYWANGIMFDFAILEDAMNQCKLDLPWKYYQLFDYRTLNKLVVAECPVRTGTKHNALADATNQARQLDMLLKALNAANAA